jgi:flavin reductase (DIM6/NTAB) family NADH-FMN oxidoreductase RutF
MTLQTQQHAPNAAIDHGPRTAPETALNARTLREAFGRFPSGVIAVCGMADNRPTGMAVSSFTPVSLEPPLVSVCLQLSSNTWPWLRDLPHLGLSVLGENQGPACSALSGPQEGRFTEVGWESDENGAVFLRGAVTWYSCTLHAEVPAGDHCIALLEIVRLWTPSAAEPLVFHGSRFRRLESREPVAAPAA